MIHLIALQRLIHEVDYKDWCFKFGFMGNGFFVQVVLPETDSKGKRWTGRKWYVSKFSTDAEVIATLFKAVTTAEEHEAREQFLYKSKAIYGPHLSLDALLANADAIKIRVQYPTECAGINAVPEEYRK